jgi:quinol---cytochrome c reductase iron-sulfur subunit, bacillus type
LNTNEENTTRSGEDKASPTRRKFLERLTIALGALAAAIVALPALGFTLAPVLRKPREVWRSVGPMAGFPVGQTVAVRMENGSALPWDGVSARMAVWLRNSGDGELTAFSVNCTHLGCPVRWEPEANLFLCPCHGGVYYSDGRVAGGPPPRPLARYPVRVRDGNVEIKVEPIAVA